MVQWMMNTQKRRWIKLSKEPQPHKHQFSFNKEERDFIDEKLDTIDRKTRIDAIKKLLLSAITGDLSLKDQLLFEKLSILKQERPIRLRKLKAQTEILEGKRRFLNHFGAELSSKGSQTLETQTKKKFGFGSSENYNESIQPKKNFFINKINDEYIGCCKRCGKFTTSPCITSREAEGDIEVHLEAVHEKELYEYWKKNLLKKKLTKL